MRRRSKSSPWVFLLIVTVLTVSSALLLVMAERQDRETRYLASLTPLRKYMLKDRNELDIV